MGEYPSIPLKPQIHFNSIRDQFETKYVQRVKETPFIDGQIYSTSPVICMDRVGYRLQTLITPRLGSNQLFPKQQIIKLLKNVCQALRELNSIGYAGHGDISSKTIYYCARSKVFKITHPVFNEDSAYLLAKNHRRFIGLSPQQLVALAQNSVESQISAKSQIFMLGIILCEVTLTLLQMCTLIPSSEIYCSNTYNIFDLQIQNRINQIKECYGHQISDLISMCLEYDWLLRPSPDELMKFIIDIETSFK